MSSQPDSDSRRDPLSPALRSDEVALSDGLSGTRPIEVTWGDCDAAGVVFYPRYYAWFDACTHTLLCGVGLDHHTLRDRHGLLGTPLVQASARFLSPSTYGDVLQADSRVIRLTARGFTVSHRFSLAGRPIVEGEETRVWVMATGDPKKPMRSADPGPDIRAILEGNSQRNIAVGASTRPTAS